MKKELTVIGSTDRIDLPQFDILDLDCKVDTGAYTSTIHCSKVQVIERDGIEHLRFWVLDMKHAQFSSVFHTTSQFEEKRVRSSNGESESRYVIRTKVILFGRTFPITFTLSDRGKMRYPVLIGKKFLQNKFLVDVSKRNLSFEMKNGISE